MLHRNICDILHNNVLHTLYNSETIPRDILKDVTHYSVSIRKGKTEHEQLKG